MMGESGAEGLPEVVQNLRMSISKALSESGAISCGA